MRRAALVATLAGCMIMAFAGPSGGIGGPDDRVEHEEIVTLPGAEGGSQPTATSPSSAQRELTPEEKKDVIDRVTLCGTLNAAAIANGSGDRVCVPPESAGPDLAGLVLRAHAELTIKFPGIQTSPPLENPSFVQIPTWFWLPESEWHPLERSVTEGGLSVTVKATPVRVRWSTGDGAEVVCEGPGKPYDYSLTEEQQSSACSHTYTKTSAGQPNETYRVTAAMEWSASYTTSIPGVEGQFEPIVVVGTADVRVGQIQAISGR